MQSTRTTFRTVEGQGLYCQPFDNSGYFRCKADNGKPATAVHSWTHETSGNHGLFCPYHSPFDYVPNESLPMAIIADARTPVSTNMLHPKILQTWHATITEHITTHVSLRFDSLHSAASYVDMLRDEGYDPHLDTTDTNFIPFDVPVTVHIYTLGGAR